MVRVFVSLFSLVFLIAPTSQPSIVPGSDAPKLIDRFGQIDALTIHYSSVQRETPDLAPARWDVVIKDRQLLAKIESMRVSDWRGMVLFVHSYAGAARIGESKFTATIGPLKVAGRPFGLTLKERSQPPILFVCTDDAARELESAIATEAERQRPK